MIIDTGIQIDKRNSYSYRVMHTCTTTTPLRSSFI